MKLKNNLYGISGKINSGKDLVGEIINYIDSVDNPTFKGFESSVVLGSDFHIKKCAEKLKLILSIILGCKRSDLEDEIFKNTILGEEWWVYSDDCCQVSYLNGDTSILDGYNIKVIKRTPRDLLQILGTDCGRDIIHPDIWVISLFSDYKAFDKGKSVIMSDWSKDYYHPSCSNCNKSYNGGKRQYLCHECILDDNYQIYPKWVITDIRYPNNEGKAISDRNGVLIGIRRHFALRFPEYEDLVDSSDLYSIPIKLREVNEKLYKSLNFESETIMGDHSWCDIVVENNGTIEELYNKILNIVK